MKFDIEESTVLCLVGINAATEELDFQIGFLEADRLVVVRFLVDVIFGRSGLFIAGRQNCSAWSLLGRNFFCRVIQIGAGTVRFDLFLFARGPLEGQDR